MHQHLHRYHAFNCFVLNSYFLRVCYMCHLKPWKSMTPMALMFREFKKRLIHDVLHKFIKALAIDSRESSLLSLKILKRASPEISLITYSSVSWPC